MKVFIAHYPKLTQRLQNLVTSLQNNQFDIKNIKVFNGICRSNINKTMFDSYVESNPKKLRVYFHILREIAPPLTSSNPAFLANFLNHHDIWNTIAKDNDDFALVLEDDAVISQSFSKIWPTLIETLPQDLDIAYLNAGCNLTPNLFGVPLKEGILWYKMPHKRSRTCCSYIISKKCASQLASITKFALNVDWEMSYHHVINNHNVYWTHPCPFVEGSGNVYKSTVR